MGIDLPGWLAERLERTYGEGNWAGKGIRPALEGLTAAEAHWRPVPAQHTIAEIAWHMAYWCWKVAHWLDPDAVTDPGEEGWRPVAPTPEAWLEVQLELERAHGAAAAVIRKFASAALADKADGPWTKLDVVVDLATHDSYHAAQIFVLRRWYAAAQGA
jgi:hypothetical protein